MEELGCGGLATLALFHVLTHFSHVNLVAQIESSRAFWPFGLRAVDRNCYWF